MKSFIVLLCFVLSTLTSYGFIKEEKGFDLWPSQIIHTALSESTAFAAIADEKNNIFIVDNKQQRIIYSLYASEKVSSFEIEKISFVDNNTICYIGKDTYLEKIKKDNYSVAYIYSVYICDIIKKEERKISEYKNISTIDIFDSKNILALGFANGDIKLYDLKESSMLLELNFSKKSIEDITLAETENRLIFVSNSKEIYEYDITTKKITHRIVSKANIKRVFYSNIDNEIIVIDESTILKYDLNGKIKSVISLKNLKIDNFNGDVFKIGRYLLLKSTNFYAIIDYNKGEVIKNELNDDFSKFSLSKDGKFYALTKSTKLNIFNSENLTESIPIISIKGLNTSLSKYEYSEESKVFSVASNNEILLWDMENGIKLDKVYDKDVQFVRFGEDRKLQEIIKNENVYVTDNITNQELFSIANNSNLNGKIIGNKFLLLNVMDSGAKCRIYNINTQKMVYEFRGELEKDIFFKNKILYAVDENGKITKLNFESNKIENFEFDYRHLKSDFVSDDLNYDLKIKGNGFISIIDCKKESEIAVFKKNYDNLRIFGLLGKSNRIMGLLNNKIVCFSSEDGKLEKEIEFLAFYPIYIEKIANSERVIVKGADGSINIVDLESGKLLYSFYFYSEGYIMINYEKKLFNSSDNLKGNIIKVDFENSYKANNSDEKIKYIEKYARPEFISDLEFQEFSNIRESFDGKILCTMTSSFKGKLIGKSTDWYNISLGVFVRKDSMNNSTINKGASLYNDNYEEIGTVDNEIKCISLEPDSDNENLVFMKFDGAINESSIRNDKKSENSSEKLGLLMTVKYEEGELRKYKTFWIVRENGILRMKKEFDKIIVATDKLQTLEKLEMKSAENMVISDEELSLGKIDSKFIFKDLDLKAKSFYNELITNKMEDGNEPAFIGEQVYNLTFINKNILSHYYSSADWATYKIYGTEDVGVFKNDAELDFNEVLMRKKESWTDYYRYESIKKGKQNLEVTGESWYIEHAKGHWKPFLVPKDRIYLSDEIEVNQTLPYSLVSDNTIYPDWEVIAKDKNVIDALSFRNYKELIIIKEDTIEGFANIDVNFKTPDFYIPMNKAKIISAQWCIGDNIAKREKELTTEKDI